MSFVVGRNGGDLFDTFDQHGRHLTTRNALTGANLLGFSYDTNGILERLTDVAGLQTQIETVAGPWEVATTLPSPEDPIRCW